MSCLARLSTCGSQIETKDLERRYKEGDVHATHRANEGSRGFLMAQQYYDAFYGLENVCPTGLPG